MAQIEQGLLGAAPDRGPVVRWPGAELRRYRDRLYAAAAYPPVDAGAVLRWYPATGPLALPGGGRLSAAPADGAGLKADRCAGGVTVRFRRGGEHCRPAGAAHRRTLKNLFQERGIPPWERARVPLIEIDGEIAAVGPFWVCAPFAAAPGERGVVIHWVRG